MPEDDPLIDLGIKVRFVVDANAAEPGTWRVHWETNLDVRKIELEVLMAKNFLEGLSQLVYFSDHEQAQLGSGWLWEENNTPSESAIRALVAEGVRRHPFFEEIGIDKLNEASSYLIFEVSRIVIGNSIKVTAHAKGRKSTADKQELWEKALQAIKVALRNAVIIHSVIGSVTINFYPTNGSAVPREAKTKNIVNESPTETPTVEVTSAEVYLDSRYTKIVENLMYPDRSKFAVEEIQELLFNFGIDCGPRDGIPGAQFKRAVAEFKNIKRVFPMSDDWRNLTFIYRLVEEAERSDRKMTTKNLKPPSSG
jgi:hypothetical protein